MTDTSRAPTEGPAGGVSYGRRLTDLAAARIDEVAAVFVAADGTESEVTWIQLEQRANQIARAMAERGVGAADLVALALPNSLELVAAVFGAWKLGAVPVPVRWDLPDWERDRLLEVVDASLAIGQTDLPWLRDSARFDASPLADATPPQTHGICSSGSTGTPKVIVIDVPGTWTDDNLALLVDPWMDVPRPQTVLVPTTLYHTNGFATLRNLLAGDRAVYLEKFDATTVVDLIERRRITTFTATPTALQRIADLPDIDHRDLSSLRWILQGAAMMPPSLARRWFDLVGPERFFMAYGMTEGMGLTALRGDEWLEHPGSVGRGIRGTEVRIIGADGGDLPAGEIGGIHLRSPTAAMYTYRGASARPAASSDGFATAGDLGWLDSDGYLHIADRRVDMIITGGANVFPAEVESALIEHPGVADVVVIGLRDPSWGRRVHAVIEPAANGPAPEPDDIITFAKSRLAGYKVPKSVEIVDRMPRSESMKISRAALIEQRGG